MMRTTKYFFIIAFSFLIACGTTRRVTVAPPAKIILDSSKFLSIYKQTLFDCQWMNAKAHIKVDQDDNPIDFSTTIRIKKDSAIWMSITPALGIEVMRVLMTNDSIYVIDRLNKTFYKKGYDFFKSFSSVPVTFQTLQNIFYGHPLYLPDSSFSVLKKDSFYTVSSRRDNMTNFIEILPYLATRSDSLSDEQTGRAIAIQYGNYNYDTLRLFPFDRLINIYGDRPVTISMHFTKVKINVPQKFPFK
jgi:hypothetical protein